MGTLAWYGLTIIRLVGSFFLFINLKNKNQIVQKYSGKLLLGKFWEEKTQTPMVIIFSKTKSLKQNSNRRPPKKFP